MFPLCPSLVLPVRFKRLWTLRGREEEVREENGREGKR
jgi:hypothetical protein